MWLFPRVPSTEVRTGVLAGLIVALPSKAHETGSPWSRPLPQQSDFSSFNLVGNAELVGTTLRLTSDDFLQVGGAWRTPRESVAGGFSVEFTFRIRGIVSAGADGLAFVIQNSSVDALGGLGGSLGYGEARIEGDRNGIPNSVAIEFDTFPNGSDPNDNHVSVHTRGTNPNHSSESFSLGSTTEIPNLSNGAIHAVRVDYVPGSLSIFLDDPAAPALEVTLDLETTLDLPDGRAFLGFTAATGASSELHEVLSFELNPKPIALCGGREATLTGTEGDDVLLGTPDPDVIAGLDGNDRLEGAGGNDLLCGGAGFDVLIGGRGSDQLFGEAGNDGLDGREGADVLDGGDGFDLLDGGEDNDLIDGMGGSDDVDAGPGEDLVRGGEGDDSLQGRSGNDRILGEGGDDILDGGPGLDTCAGGAERVGDRALACERVSGVP